VLPLERVGEHRYEVRTPLAREGVVLASVALGDDKMLSLPPLALPYSPEFEPSSDPHRGERCCARSRANPAAKSLHRSAASSAASATRGFGAW
jgi:hypothetical protein